MSGNCDFPAKKSAGPLQPARGVITIGVEKWGTRPIRTRRNPPPLFAPARARVPLILQGSAAMSASFDSPPPFEPADILTASPHTHLRRLVVTTRDGEVVISGRVPSYYLKQMAQEAIRSCLGPRRLRNEVQVCSA